MRNYIKRFCAACFYEAVDERSKLQSRWFDLQSKARKGSLETGEKVELEKINEELEKLDGLVENSNQSIHSDESDRDSSCSDDPEYPEY